MPSTEYRIGHLTLQPQRQLLDGAHALPVGGKALALLSVLAEAHGALVTKDELMAAVWPGVIVEENAIQVHIAALRKLMGDAATHLFTLRGQGYRLDVVASAPPPPETVLAVLPFDNLSSDAEMDFFSDGVSEEILGRLTRGSKLKMIGRTSSFQFRGTAKAGAAAALDATHILDGSIRRAGSRVRISAHLLEAATQESLWSEQYDRSLEDIFAVQDEISERIAQALNSTFFPLPTAAIDPLVYDLYLRAKVRHLDHDLTRQNIASLEHVIRTAPGFADGWGTLALRRAEILMHSSYQTRAQQRAIIEGDIAKCLALDLNNPDALVARLYLFAPFGAFLAIDQALADAEAAESNSATIETTGAFIAACVGRTREAALRASRAMSLDLLNNYAVAMTGRLLWQAGSQFEGRVIIKRALEQWPDDHHNTAAMITICAHEGEWATVDRLIDPARLALHPLREYHGMIRWTAAMRDPSPASRRRLLDAVADRVAKTGHMDASAAVAIAEAGFVDDVFDLLERACLGPSGDPNDMMGDGAYRPFLLFQQPYTALRHDPRFVTLCARLGLVEYWLETQKWPDCADEVPYEFRAECEKARFVPREVFGF